ncbi:MAG: DUF885 domain-containing protein, partial [Hyphomonas sp.]
MKPAICGLILMAASPLALADPLIPLIGEYEAHVRAANPAEAAQAQGKPPTRWRDVSPAARQAQADRAAALLAQIKAAPTERLTDQAILQRLLADELSGHANDAARIPFTGDWGFHAEPMFAAMRLRIRSEADALAWIARLNDVPRYFNQHRENMVRGIETGWTGHGDPLATTRAQIAAQIVDTPEESELYQPFLNLPEAISPESRSRLQSAGLEATAWALQAYRETLEFIDGTYAPAARPEPGIAALPGGQDVYAGLVDSFTAGAGYSAEEIHAIGQNEVARIRAEMEAIIAELAFDGSFAEFQHYLRTDPQFYAQTEGELMAAAREISSRLDAMLPLYFNRLPRLGYTVDPVPLSIAPGYTTGRYAAGDQAEGREGSYLVNTWALDQRPLYELPALSAHEAVPGHHLQIALAQEMEDQPRFRQEYYATAFGEGWGLYAEYLAGEGGIYRTPYERFGALSYEMWRACRLVSDTGL